MKNKNNGTGNDIKKNKKSSCSGVPNADRVKAPAEQSADLRKKRVSNSSGVVMEGNGPYVRVDIPNFLDYSEKREDRVKNNYFAEGGGGGVALEGIMSVDEELNDQREREREREMGLEVEVERGRER